MTLHVVCQTAAMGVRFRALTTKKFPVIVILCDVVIQSLD